MRRGTRRDELDCFPEFELEPEKVFVHRPCAFEQFLAEADRTAAAFNAAAAIFMVLMLIAVICEARS
jgi:hypothetical protein